MQFIGLLSCTFWGSLK